MIQLKPFRPDKAAHVQFGELHTDFILPTEAPSQEVQGDLITARSADD